MGSAQRLSDRQVDSAIECVALDVDFLNRNTFGDVALRREILGLFSAQVDGVGKTLILPLDAKAWVYLTHTLKGAAAAVGAHQIMKLAEQWGQTPPPATATQRNAMRATLVETVTAFNHAATGLN